MRVGARTTLVLIVVAAVPVAIAGWTTRSLSRTALADRAEIAAERGASALANRLADSVRSRLRVIELAAAAIDLDSLSDEDKVWALRLVFRQVPDASAVALIGNDGKPVVAPVFLDEVPDDEALSGRPVLSADDLDRFGGGIPHELAAKVGRALGLPYVSKGGSPRLVVAVRASGQKVLAVELALDGLVPLLGEHGAGQRGQAFAVDSTGRVILSEDSTAIATRQVRSGWSLISRAAKARDNVVGSFRASDGTLQLGAAVRVADLGWTVVVAEPQEDALAIARAVTTRMIVWLVLALAGALILGILVSRALLRPLRRLVDGAHEIQAGNIAHRVVGVERSDELGDLARAFNSMAEEVERWRVDLEDKVEERTRELHESQDLLARAQKMAAVGQLGAGVAHEINNPLFALAGMAELLQTQEEPGTRRHENLTLICQQAARIQEIVARLLALADSVESSERAEINVLDPLRKALARLGEGLDLSELEVEEHFDDPMPPIRGDADSLTEVFFGLLENGCEATQGRGKLSIRAEAVDGQMIRIRFTDDGRGIPKDIQHRVFDPFFTIQPKKGSKGLGLSTAQQVITAHDGKVLLDSEPGKGTTFTVLLPAVQRRSLS